MLEFRLQDQHICFAHHVVAGDFVWMLLLVRVVVEGICCCEMSLMEFVEG